MRHVIDVIRVTPKPREKIVSVSVEASLVDGRAQMVYDELREAFPPPQYEVNVSRQIVRSENCTKEFEEVRRYTR